VNDESLKLSQEVAEEQINLLLEYYDIDLEDPNLDEDEIRGIKSAARKLTRAVRRGGVEIKDEDDGLAVYVHLRHPPKGTDESIRFREVDGKAKVAMKDVKSATDHHGRLYKMMANLSGESLSYPKLIALKGVDLATVECLGLLFLQV